MHFKPICLSVLYVTETAKQMLLAMFFPFAWCTGNLHGYFSGSSTQQQEGENIFESVIVKPQNTAWEHGHLSLKLPSFQTKSNMTNMHYAL